MCSFEQELKNLLTTKRRFAKCFPIELLNHYMMDIIANYESEESFSESGFKA